MQRTCEDPCRVQVNGSRLGLRFGERRGVREQPGLIVVFDGFGGVLERKLRFVDYGDALVRKFFGSRECLGERGGRRIGVCRGLEC